MHLWLVFSLFISWKNSLLDISTIINMGTMFMKIHTNTTIMWHSLREWLFLSTRSLMDSASEQVLGFQTPLDILYSSGLPSTRSPFLSHLLPSFKSPDFRESIKYEPSCFLHLPHLWASTSQTYSSPIPALFLPPSSPHLPGARSCMFLPQTSFPSFIANPDTSTLL